jgi:hypothetical protein
MRAALRRRYGHVRSVRKFVIDDPVLVRAKHAHGFPKTPGIVHDIREGKYEIRWSDGDSGWFASSDLRRVF